MAVAADQIFVKVPARRIERALGRRSFKEGMRWRLKKGCGGDPCSETLSATGKLAPYWCAVTATGRFHAAGTAGSIARYCRHANVF
jgi:hypothetical protein